MSAPPAGRLLPPTGLGVVVECRPTDPADRAAVVATAHDAKGRTTLTLTKNGAPDRLFSGADFPLL